MFFLTGRAHFMSMNITKWIYDRLLLSLTDTTRFLLGISAPSTGTKKDQKPPGPPSPLFKQLFPLKINTPKRILWAPWGWVLGAEWGWCDTETGVSQAGLKLDIAAEHRREAQATRNKIWDPISNWDARRVPFHYSRGPIVNIFTADISPAAAEGGLGMAGSTS